VRTLNSRTHFSLTFELEQVEQSSSFWSCSGPTSNQPAESHSSRKTVWMNRNTCLTITRSAPTKIPISNLSLLINLEDPTSSVGFFVIFAGNFYQRFFNHNAGDGHTAFHVHDWWCLSVPRPFPLGKKVSVLCFALRLCWLTGRADNPFPVY